MLADNYMLFIDTKAGSNRRGRCWGMISIITFREKEEIEDPGSVQEGESGGKLA